MKKYNLDITVVVMGLPMSGDTIKSGQPLGGCVTGDTPIDIPRDLKAYPTGIPIREVCQRIKSGEKLLVYSYDAASGRICLRPVTKAWKTKSNAEVWELIYSWETKKGNCTASVRATPDHRIMLRDGTYKPLCELQSNDSLMPFNRYQGPTKESKYYRLELNNGDWAYEHVFVTTEQGLPYTPRRGHTGDVVHHVNFKWFDNSATNLRVMTWQDHLALHKGSNKAFREWYDNLSPEEYKEFCRKQSALAHSFWDNASKKERNYAIKTGLKALKRWHKNASIAELKAKHDKISRSNKIAFSVRPELRALLVANGKKSGIIGGWNKGKKQTDEVKAKMRALWANPEKRTGMLAQLATARLKINLVEAARKAVKSRTANRLAANNHTVVSVQSLNQREDVYDLEVEGTHNFAANGVIVHNSETAGAQACAALAKLGHRVTLFCNTENQHVTDGVTYLPFGWVPGVGPGATAQFPKGMFDYLRATPADVVIVQRQPMVFQFEYPSKCNILWQHDLATKSGPSNFGHVVWNLDRIWMLSQFMKRQYQSVHGGPDSLYRITRNGVDLDLIDSVPTQERDRFKCMFTARPERGLDILLAQAWPEILKREPRARLYLSRYQDPTTLPLYTELAQLAKQYGDSVVDLGHLGKQELYKHYKQARLFLYPSTFEEISHISQVEVGGCGAVMVGPWKGACPETAAGTHVLLRDDGSVGAEGDPVDPGLKLVTPAFVKSFVDHAVALIHDDARWGLLAKAARARAEQWQWGPVAEDWTEQFHEIIGRKSADPKRMVKHLLVKSDVVAAEKYAAVHPEDPSLAKAVSSYVDRFVPFMRQQGDERRQALAAFYEERSGGVAADYRTAFWADTEPRCKVLIDWLQKHPEVKAMMDFGCAHGGYVRAVSNALPSLSVLGVDISPALIRCCEELKVAALPNGSPAFDHPENVAFVVGDEDTIIVDHEQELILAVDGKTATGPRKLFDCVVCMDTLEHLPHAEEVVAKLEKHCKPNGWVVLTVPTGNRERSDFVMKGVPPVHVRAFDQHDLLDLFSHKKDFHVLAFSDLAEAELDRTFSGWYFIAYRNDGEPLGQIDYERKFFLQGPRETLAVCMIVNNTEDVMHRCLRSVQKIADQIVIIDNGPSTDRTVNVALEYTPDVRAGTSPFFCYAHLCQHAPTDIQPGACDMAGFETPRNESIEGVWADWILWIDADEQLLEWRSLWKYLRSSALLGYAMQQHHIAVDPPGVLKRDIPVRLFRNHADMRFLGKVHEHAETGINKGVGQACLLIPDVHIHHDGYLTETIRRGRFWRNFKLLECDRLKYPDRILGMFLYEIRDSMHLAKYAMEQNGMQVTPDVRARLNTVVNTFRQNFLQSEYAFLTEDALNYYSEALAYLGAGLEVVVALDVKPQGAQPGGPQRFRCGDQAEAKLILDKIVGAKFAPFEGPYAR